ncbi:signal peptidase II, partial [Glycomyces tenuis]
ATAALLAATDLVLKAWAGRGLADGASVDLGLIQLRLAFNSGVAFSLGDDLPGWVVIAVTAMITAGLAVVVWRSARTAPLPAVALSVALAGAVANLVDRAADGVVTDYLHTGWFPTFNLADVYITVGVLAFAVLNVFGSDHDRVQQPARDD